MRKIYMNFPITHDIVDAYRTYRRNGNTRGDAIAKLRAEYAQELADCDDGPVVRIGLALALCQKRELTSDVLKDAQSSVEELLAEDWDKKILTDLHDLADYIGNPKWLGTEARYPLRRLYIPQWEIGDTFSHPLTIDMARYLGIGNWYVLFRKDGEYVDKDQRPVQLVYASLCPPDQLPHTSEELHNLGFIRMLPDCGKWDYLGRFTFKSQKDEASYELTKIGNFPDAGHPKSWIEESPWFGRPLFGKIKRDSQHVDYEEDICFAYRNNGIGI